MRSSNRNRRTPYSTSVKSNGEEIFFKANNQTGIITESSISCYLCNAHTICHSTESIVFIQCTNCHNWFHSQCLQFTYSLLTSSTPTIFKEGLWYCKKCFLATHLFPGNTSNLCEFQVFKNKKTIERKFYLFSTQLQLIANKKIPKNSIIQINSNTKIELKNKMDITKLVEEFNSINIEFGISLFTNDNIGLIVLVDSNIKPKIEYLCHCTIYDDMKLINDYFNPIKNNNNDYTIINLIDDDEKEEHVSENDDDEIELCDDYISISLSCPLGLNMIKNPVKGKNCNHLQCFDFDNYYNINDNNPKMRCPVCNKRCDIHSLLIDDFMSNILTIINNNNKNKKKKVKKLNISNESESDDESDEDVFQFVHIYKNGNWELVNDIKTYNPFDKTTKENENEKENVKENEKENENENENIKKQSPTTVMEISERNKQTNNNITKSKSKMKKKCKENDDDDEYIEKKIPKKSNKRKYENNMINLSLIYDNGNYKYENCNTFSKKCLPMGKIMQGNIRKYEARNVNKKRRKSENELNLNNSMECNNDSDFE